MFSYCSHHRNHNRRSTNCHQTSGKAIWAKFYCKRHIAFCHCKIPYLALHPGWGQWITREARWPRHDSPPYNLTSGADSCASSSTSEVPYGAFAHIFHNSFLSNLGHLRYTVSLYSWKCPAYSRRWDRCKHLNSVVIWYHLGLAICNPSLLS